jgi:hypothetical protein
MREDNKPKSRREDIVVQEVDGEVLIYDLKTDKAFCLNRTSALVWQACDGTKTIAEINDLVGKQLNAKVKEDVIWLALDQLSKEKLVDAAIANKTVLSRREVITRIGMTSAVALPIIAHIVAPPAAAAQTCLPRDAACIASIECCSGCCKNVSPGINQCKPGGGACLP